MKLNSKFEETSFKFPSSTNSHTELNVNMISWDQWYINTYIQYIQLGTLSSEFFFFLQDNMKYPLAPAYHSAKSVKLTNDLIRVLRRQILIQFRRRKNLRRKKSWGKTIFAKLMLMEVFSDSCMNKATFWWMESVWI